MTMLLQWMNFALQHDYGFDLGGVRVNLKGPAPDDPINNFIIDAPSFNKAVAVSQDDIHGPINLFDVSWPCEIQTPQGIEIQGSVLMTFKLFHSLEFGCCTDGKIDTEDDLKKAIINLANLGFESSAASTPIYPTRPEDITTHNINGRLWHESLTALIPGWMSHNLYTRLNNDLTLSIFINLTTFWGNQKLPDPEHKRQVFASILDFLSHIQIRQPGEYEPTNPPPLGLHSPIRQEVTVETLDADDVDW